MDILFFADNFPPERNAQASRVYERACYWVEWGHKVTVITCAPNFPEGKVYPGYRNAWHTVETISGIRVVRVKTFISANSGTVLRILDFLSYMVSASVTALFECKPTLIVATSPQFFAAVAGCMASTLRRVPFVFELSDLWPESISAVGAMKKNVLFSLIERLELLLYRRSARIVALTSAFKDNLISRGVAPEKISVILNGVDLRRYKPRPRNSALAAEWGIKQQELVVGYIGTLGMAHALENVLQCAQRTLDKPIRYLFVGTGAMRDFLQHEAKRLDLPNVTFVPAQAKDRMPEFWSLCHVALVHLKNHAVFQTVIPSKIFEAMAMGRALLIASPKGEGARIVVDENAGIWVPPEDPDALAKAVLDLARDRHALARFAHNSLMAAPRFTRERQALEMEKVLENVVDGETRVAQAAASTLENT